MHVFLMPSVYTMLSSAYTPHSNGLASYHHPRGDDWVYVSSMNKPQLAAKLVELGVNSVTVQRLKKGTSTRESFQFDASSFARRGGRFAPTRDELIIIRRDELIIIPVLLLGYQMPGTPQTAPRR
jgi:hypothetical protein